MPRENRFGAVFCATLIVLAVCAALVGRARGDEPSAAARSALAMTFGTHAAHGCACPAEDCSCPPGTCACAGCKTCPTCGAHCGCTPEDGCGDRDCPAVPYGKGLWLLKAGLRVPDGYRWNAVDGRAFRPAPKVRFVQSAPVYFAPPPVFQSGFGDGFNGGGGGRRGGSC